MADILLDVLFYPLFHVAVRLPGYLLLRCFYRAEELELEGNEVAVAGILLWVVVGLSIALAVWL